MSSDSMGKVGSTTPPMPVTSSDKDEGSPNLPAPPATSSAKRKHRTAPAERNLFRLDGEWAPYGEKGPPENQQRLV